jgi:hypothetical protein
MRIVSVGPNGLVSVQVSATGRSRSNCSSFSQDPQMLSSDPIRNSTEPSKVGERFETNRKAAIRAGSIRSNRARSGLREAPESSQGRRVVSTPARRLDAVAACHMHGPEHVIRVVRSLQNPTSRLQRTPILTRRPENPPPGQHETRRKTVPLRQPEMVLSDFLPTTSTTNIHKTKTGRASG